MDLDFLSQVLKFIQDFGGLPKMAKIAGVVLLVVESMKVSFLKPQWDKLGAYKMLVAPALGVVAGLVMLPSLNLEAAMAYLLAGAGAILLHDLLQAVKGLPGVSLVAQKVLDILSSLIGPKK